MVAIPLMKTSKNYFRYGYPSRIDFYSQIKANKSLVVPYKIGNSRKQQNPLIISGFCFIEVPRTRLELAHRNRNQPLKLACLPISPSGQTAFSGCKYIKNFKSVILC